MTARLVLGFLLLHPLGAFAGDEQRWAQAMAEAQRLAGSKDPADRARAAQAIGNATYEKRDKQAVSLLHAILAKEFAQDRGGTGRDEDKVSGEVLNACEEALKKIKSKEAIDLVAKLAKDRGQNPRARFYLCRALGAYGEASVKTLIELLDDKDTRVQIGAADGLAASGHASAAEPLLRVVQEDRPWECKTVALAALEKMLIEQRGVLRIAHDTNMDQLTKDVAACGADIRRKEGNAVVVTCPPNDLSKVKTELLKNHKVLMDGVALVPKDDAQAGKVADSLINALEKAKDDEGRIKSDLIRLLGALLWVEDPKTDDAGWWRWLRGTTNGDGRFSGTQVEPTEFFGLKAKSTRIVFVLDRTGSMAEPCTWDDKPAETQTPAEANAKKLPPQEEAARARALEIKKKWESRPVKTRMDGLKREFLRTIYNLDARVHFTVVWYEAKASPDYWKEQLVPATWQTKLECMQDADRIQPSGGTNIWAGLEAAFKLVEQPQRQDVIQVDRKGNYASVVNGADTFFLMTDGNHNNGKFVNEKGRDPEPDVAAFLGEVKKVNALRKVIIHTIALGDTTAQSQDPITTTSLDLLKRIAESSGGNFVHIGK